MLSFTSWIKHVLLFSKPNVCQVPYSFSVPFRFTQLSLLKTSPNKNVSTGDDFHLLCATNIFSCKIFFSRLSWVVYKEAAKNCSGDMKIIRFKISSQIKVLPVLSFKAARNQRWQEAWLSFIKSLSGYCTFFFWIYRNTASTWICSRSIRQEIMFILWWTYLCTYACLRFTMQQPAKHYFVYFYKFYVYVLQHHITYYSFFFRTTTLEN